MAVIIISPVLASASPAAKISKPAAQAQKESRQQNTSASVSSKMSGGWKKPKTEAGCLPMKGKDGACFAYV
jgi:hypothetical protein